MLGPFFRNQIPAQTLIVNVTDPDGQKKDLSVYSTAKVLFIDPFGASVPLSGSETQIIDAPNGVVGFNWPAPSILNKVGDYKIQVELTNGSIKDFTNVGVFEVYEGLGGH